MPLCWRHHCFYHITHIVFARKTLLPMYLSEPVSTLSEAIWTFLNLSEPIWTYLNLSELNWIYPNLSEPIQTYLNISKLIWTYPNLSLAIPTLSKLIWTYLNLPQPIQTYLNVYSLLFCSFFTLQMLCVIMLGPSKYLTICDHLKISRTAFCFIKLIYCLFLLNYFVQTFCLYCLLKEGSKLYKFCMVLFKCRSYFWFSDCPLLKKSQSSDASPIHILMTQQTSTTRNVYCVILWLYLINIFVRLNISFH